MNDKIYKGKYCIGIYENNEGEQLIGLFDTPQELADYMEITLNHARALVSQHSKGKRTKILINDKFVSLVLVDMTE